LVRKLFIVAAALFVLVGTFILKERESSSSVANPEITPEGVSGVAQARRQELSREKQLPRLVDLGADKCVPCKKMVPILKELSTEYSGSLTVEFIDVWKNPEAGKPYGIRMIPTQIFFDASGTERFRHEGFMAKETILAKWKELGVELNRRSAKVGQ
jgi:thioredoxin 1